MGMPFSDTSGGTGIIQVMETLLDLGAGGISGNSTLLKQLTAIINVDAYDDVIAEILKNEGTWNWDSYEYGNSNFPVNLQNLSVTAGSEVSNYALPVAGSPGSTDLSSFLRLIKVQVKDSAGNRQNLYPIDESAFEVPLETQFQSPGFPKYYRQMGQSLILYPPPLAAMVTATNGLVITYQRDKVDFLTSDTTKQPGFPAIYHYLLPLKASETWAGIKGMRQITLIQEKIAKFTQNLGWGVANRDKDLRQRVRGVQSFRNPNYF